MIETLELTIVGLGERMIADRRAESRMRTGENAEPHPAPEVSSASGVRPGRVYLCLPLRLSITALLSRVTANNVKHAPSAMWCKDGTVCM